ncbi:cryptochrome/photolyase family protein [Maribacter algarum]|uniref:Cryptochrome/photolyase family protein n=1 Tax=Maribacter algarum (ex Zhang et al. 2020) TaxID=2578118 RepID=A0A5S3PWU4_9FLAO|nr:cryptochrome/photolyase family protein [Maribacter algarum]TMM59320.1 cryptochrome/photolyase family protein [Maribacter algarum]
MKAVNLIFPHQLFEVNPLFENGHAFYLIEEFLFFMQYPFHKQKIAFHRATMQFYLDFLRKKGHQVNYVEATDETSDIRKLIPVLTKEGIQEIHYLDPADYWLEKRIAEGCASEGIRYNVHDSPMYLNSKEDLKNFFREDKKKFYQTKFYTGQRKARNILLDENGKPKGGKWTYDTENRKKYPAKKVPPSVQYPDNDSYFEEAKSYVEANFENHYGELTEQLLYPNTFEKTQTWFTNFLETRFSEFGVYEDAIVAENSILNHSVLTPMLNVGLITPQEIVDKSLAHAEQNDIPINSTEGFIRQIIGWREFIRGVYVAKGSYERTKHFWKFHKKIPKSFYDGTTGIPPIDLTIKKVSKTGYCHHIERLMVLGNFMVLCEFDPDEVYQWFMELFIDAYDWVMVPNVYGMSQFADGGLMSTKPYISSSNYLMKMSNYKKGKWQETWDGLFWRFMNKHRDFFLSNPRLGMLIRTFDKMSEEKKQAHLKNGELFLNQLEGK